MRHRSADSGAVHLPGCLAALQPVPFSAACSPSWSRATSRGLLGAEVFTNVFDSLPTEFSSRLRSPRSGDGQARSDAEREQDSPVILIQDVQGNESSFLLAAMPKARYSERIRAGFQSALTRATGAGILTTVSLWGATTPSCAFLHDRGAPALEG